MNADLQKALAEILAALKDASQVAANAAKDELPILVKEYLAWGLLERIGWFVVLAIVVGILMYVATQMKRSVAQYKSFMEVPTSLEPAWAFGKWTIPIACVIVSMINISVNLMPAIKIMVAPRVYLLEQLSGLVK